MNNITSTLKVLSATALMIIATALLLTAGANIIRCLVLAHIGFSVYATGAAICITILISGTTIICAADEDLNNKLAYYDAILRNVLYVTATAVFFALSGALVGAALHSIYALELVYGVPAQDLAAVCAVLGASYALSQLLPDSAGN